MERTFWRQRSRILEMRIGLYGDYIVPIEDPVAALTGTEKQGYVPPDVTASTDGRTIWTKLDQALGVTNCNHRPFFDRINCDYRGHKNHIVCDQTAIIGLEPHYLRLGFHVRLAGRPGA